MNVQGNTLTGTVLVAMGFRDFVCIHYNVFPTQPPDQIIRLKHIL